MNVAIVAPSLAILGGQAVQADRLIRSWQGDPDVRAWLVPVNPAPPAGLRWATRIKYLRTVVTQLLYWPLLFRELSRADVVHVFSASYASFLLSPLPAIIVARLLRRPVVLNYRSGEAPDHLRRSRIARWVLSRVDRNVVPSRFLVEVFAGFGIRASVIPNIVDITRFRFRERDPLRPRLVSTRNLAYPYNVACTLRAFQIVQRDWPDATLTLVGDGADAPALRALASALALRHVTFAGRVHPDAIAEHYAASDIYIQSPDIDNTPTSIIEAFASGLPAVSTSAGGVPVLMTHGEHGLLAAPDDHEALAGCVLGLLAEPNRARALARTAYASSAQYTWPAVRAEWLGIYQNAASQRTRRQAVRVVTPAGADR